MFFGNKYAESVKIFVIISDDAKIKGESMRDIQIHLTEGRISVIDIHSHILDSLDGSIKTEEGSLKILRFAAGAGVTDIIATPCIMKCAEQCEWHLIKERTAMMNKRVEAAGVSIRVHSGAELAMNWELLSLLKTGQRDYCLADSNYVLIGLVGDGLPHYADDFLYELQVKELIPVIARPERSKVLAEQPQILHEWVKNGVLVQSNLSSFTYKYGAKVKNYADFLLENNMVHFLGSDARKLEFLEKDVAAASDELKNKLLPIEFRRIAVENPRAILENRFLDVSVPATIKMPGEKHKGFFASLFGERLASFF